MKDLPRVQNAPLSEAQMRNNVVGLVFGGDGERFQAFCQVAGTILPHTTSAVLRGSAVSGARWNDGAPFDASPSCPHATPRVFGSCRVLRPDEAGQASDHLPLETSIDM